VHIKPQLILHYCSIIGRII